MLSHDGSDWNNDIYEALALSHDDCDGNDIYEALALSTTPGLAALLVAPFGRS